MGPIKQNNFNKMFFKFSDRDFFIFLKIFCRGIRLWPASKILLPPLKLCGLFDGHLSFKKVLQSAKGGFYQCIVYHHPLHTHTLLRYFLSFCKAFRSYEITSERKAHSALQF